MSKKPDSPDSRHDDSLSDERLHQSQHSKEYKDAVNSNPDKFTSFSEGMPSVDKFEITDSDQENSTSTQSTREATDKLETAIEFLGSTKCRYLLRYQCGQEGMPVDGENSDCRTSPSLDGLISLLTAVPWSDKIKVQQTDTTEPSDYSFKTDTIVLNQSLSDDRLILTFAHQLYHATNKSLIRLYGDNEIELNDFIDIQIWSEVAALVAELNVRKELGLKVAPPRVLCQEKSGSLFSINVGEYLESKGMKSLSQMLKNSMIRGSKTVRLTDIYSSMHDVYTNNFRAEKIKANCYVELCIATGLEKDRL